MPADTRPADVRSSDLLSQEIRAIQQNGSTPDPGLGSRLNFLYKMVEDTQGTIRFIDTKAAFCVTLLSAMTAAALQRPPTPTALHRALFLAFMSLVLLSLLICLRVIFPTIKPSASIFGSTGPKFYIGHNKAHHWILHTIKDRVGEVLAETHTTFLQEMSEATDYDLLNSMCDEVLMIALIRQVKSDRLHAAMFSIAATVLLFATLMIA